MRNFFLRRKLRDKLLLSYFLVLVIPIIVISLVFSSIAVRSLEEAATEFASLITSQIEASVDSFIGDCDRISKTIFVETKALEFLGNYGSSSMVDKIENKLIIDRLMLRLTTLRPEVYSIILVGANRQVYQSPNSRDTINADILMRQPWFQRLRRTNGALLITPTHDSRYYDTNKTEAFFSIGRVFVDLEGKFLGVLLFDIKPGDLLNQNENLTIARNQYDIRILIKTRDNGVVYDSDILKGRETWEQAYRPRSGVAPDASRGREMVVSMASATGRLIVSTRIPRHQLFAKISRLKYFSLGVLIVSLLVISGLSLAFSYGITRPIQALQKNMKLVESGRYQPLRPPEADDEIAALINSYNLMVSKVKSLIEDVYLAEIKQKQAKFLALQNQINPHMLYNTLESIRMKAVLNQDHEAAEMVKILAKMFRLALGKEGAENSIAAEIEYARNYLKLQNIRFNQRFSLHVNLEAAILDSPIICLVFQPIIENSIIHGFLDHDRDFAVAITGRITPEADIVIQISDNGVGIDARKVDEINRALQEAQYDPIQPDHPDATRLGLKNIAERIRIQYGEKYYVKIAANPSSGATVEIRIPKQ
jgi:two-component system sensor histidine kinase YesM